MPAEREPWHYEGFVRCYDTIARERGGRDYDPRLRATRFQLDQQV